MSRIVKRLVALTLGLLWLFHANLNAQDWTLWPDSIGLPTDIGTAFWIDRNGDGFQDLFLVPEGDQPDFVYTAMIDSTGVVSLDSVPLLDGDRFRWAAGDVNNDIWPDIIQSGYQSDGAPFTRVWIDLGGDWERPSAAHWPVVGQPTVVDVDHNGRQDVVVLGEHQTEGLGLWVMSSFAEGWAIENLADSLTLDDAEPEQVWFQDLNRDGWEEIILQTRKEGVAHWMAFRYLPATQSYSSYSIVMPAIAPEAVAWGDYTHDGYVDVFVQGQDEESTALVAQIFENVSGLLGTQPITDLTVETLEEASAHLVDITGDGLADLVHSGLRAGNPVTLVYAQGDPTPMEARAAKLPVGLPLGHADWSGRLQMFADSLVTDTTRPRNVGPFTFEDWSITTYHGITTFAWPTGALDDYTPDASMTFDFKLWTSSEYIVAGSGGGRGQLITGPGRTGYFPGYAVSGLQSGRYQWSVDGIDNAYWTALCTGGSGGGTGSPGNCFELLLADTTVCKNIEVEIFSPWAGAELEWTDGGGTLLGSGESITLLADKNMTIQGEGIDPEGCFVNYVLTLVVDELSDRDMLGEDVTICLGDAAEFLLPDSAVGDWYQDAVLTQEQVGGYIFNGTAGGLYQLAVEGTTPDGCQFTDSVNITVSAPEITMPANQIITAGEVVQLPAEGEGTFQWSPAENLNDPTAAAPEANPKETVVYTAILTDSVGCTVEGSVEVEVKGVLFLPELFSPNGDGNNDAFRVYGSGLAELSLRIFDRDGRMVFSSTDPGQILAQGWDGTFQGKQLPAETYTWVLSATYIDGTPATFEGKTTGTIRLIR